MTDDSEHHVEDQLPLLLTGEATPAQVDEAVAHLRTRAECREVMVDLIEVHAPLASAARFAPEAVRAPVDERPMPDLRALFAEAQAEQEQHEVTVRQRRRAPIWLAAAVAAGLIIGGGGVALLAHSSSNGGSSPGSATTVALGAYGKGTVPASMKVRTSGGDSIMQIKADALPSLAGAQRYEVWLTNAARTAMQPVGWLGADNTATIAVPSNLSALFDNVEVSVQSMTAPSYEYSGTSVLRGSY